MLRFHNYFINQEFSTIRNINIALNCQDFLMDTPTPALSKVNIPLREKYFLRFRKVYVAKRSSDNQGKERHPLLLICSGGFRLDTRRNSCTEMVVRHWERLPGESIGITIPGNLPKNKCGYGTWGQGLVVSTVLG